MLHPPPTTQHNQDKINIEADSDHKPAPEISTPAGTNRKGGPQSNAPALTAAELALDSGSDEAGPESCGPVTPSIPITPDCADSVGAHVAHVIPSTPIPPTTIQSTAAASASNPLIITPTVIPSTATLTLAHAFPLPFTPATHVGSPTIVDLGEI
ncbi:hypothetical protein MJO28_006220 [Puccinia striiformis f. sp. tritici]|uniref:Uncharacterized protein n=2 Tax=Puccinia striiformis f. sp. tritici TaxID=168172 RepID=A0A0L0VL36_9BASI|nr:hypothetical protein Pst134EA_011418 [Puccinia striiformis f. sp. tritici]KAH9467792.1 hypothetical protein Pst134EA_011418 [Puccinia striiformis f. sp. tritici]KAI7953673.1 hypothetical protein MJO28_006220 [Puccinia striiformis f. sp. tritici]KAI9608292.1 hypothetical protein KEM48_003223 [Puccinia striiformis f. sp. tritici PST-130]KNE99965.1 hypothetical protein PSTG_06817 [Puccinia striiformis f. sp. tritici PST-78]